MDLKNILNELDAILDRFRELTAMGNDRPKPASEGEDAKVEGVEGENISALTGKAIASVRRISGSDSDYTLAITAVAGEQADAPGQTGLVFGVVKALRDDIQNGRFQPVATPFHFDAETFGGFLNVAVHQLSRGDRKAAVVLAGSTLETHLKKLASGKGLNIEDEEGNALPVAQVVRELVENGVFDSEEQQRVEEWLALREAASAGAGDTEQISEERVRTMIAGIKAFLLRNPA
ncbi:MAG: hypothetical protein EA363_11265 [Balneolaceae bacterium]|nr:MAG: hypothetical protein EA363_11265 [Balneolaceae bacterium]